MITGFLLNVLLVLVALATGLLPVVPFPAAITNAFSLIWYYMNAMSFLFPVGTLLQVLTLAFMFHFTLMGWRLSLLVVRFIRGM